MQTLSFRDSAERKEILSKTTDFKYDVVISVDAGTQVDTVYSYSINVTVNRDLSKEEILDLENTINSLFVRYGDKAIDEQFVFDQLCRGSKVVAKFMKGGDVDIRILEKVYQYTNNRDVKFVSCSDVIVDKTQAENLQV